MAMIALFIFWLQHQAEECKNKVSCVQRTPVILSSGCSNNKKKPLILIKHKYYYKKLFYVFSCLRTQDI